MSVRKHAQKQDCSYKKCVERKSGKKVGLLSDCATGKIPMEGENEERGLGKHLRQFPEIFSQADREAMSPQISPWKRS